MVGGRMDGQTSFLGLGIMLTSFLEALHKNLGLAFTCPFTYLDSKTILAGLEEGLAASVWEGAGVAIPVVHWALWESRGL